MQNIKSPIFYAKLTKRKSLIFRSGYS